MDNFGRAKSVIGFFYEILSSSSELGICARLMAIGSPPITWDLKHTGEPWVYIGTPLPNPSGNTGVMVCVMCMYIDVITLLDGLDNIFRVFPFSSHVFIPGS